MSDIDDFLSLVDQTPAPVSAPPASDVDDFLALIDAGEPPDAVSQIEQPAPIAPVTPFDPEGADYDYESAQAAGISADETGHFPSRDPVSGLILKGRNHPTFHKTIAGEEAAGMEIFKAEDGRYYSQPKPEASKENPLDFDPTGNVAGGAEAFLSVMNEFAAAGVGTPAAALDTFFDGDINKFPKNLQKRIEQGTLIHPHTEQGKAIKQGFMDLIESYNASADEATEVLIDPAKNPELAAALNVFFKAAPFGLGLFGRGGRGKPRASGKKPIVPDEPLSPKAEKAYKLFEISRLNAEAGNSAEAVNAFSKATDIVDNAKDLGITRKEAVNLRKEAIKLKRRLNTFDDLPGPQKRGLERVADQLLEKLKKFIKGGEPVKPTEIVETKGELPPGPEIKAQPRRPSDVKIDEAIEATELVKTKAPPEARARALDADIKARVIDINERIKKGEPIGEELDSLATVKKLQDALRKKPAEEGQADFLRNEPAEVKPIKPDDPETVKARAEQLSRGPTKEGQKELENLDKEKIEQVIPEPGETPIKVENRPREIQAILGKRVDQIKQSTPEELAKMKPVVRGEEVDFPDILGENLEGIETTKGAIEGTIGPKRFGLTQGLRHKFPIEFRGDEIPLNTFTNEIGELYDQLIDAKSAEVVRPDVIRHIENEIVSRETAIARRSEEVLTNQQRLEKLKAEGKETTKQLKLGEKVKEAPKKKRTRAEFLEEIKRIDTDKQSIAEIASRMGGIDSADAVRFGFNRADMASINRTLFPSSHSNLFKKDGVPIDELHLRFNAEHGTNFKDMDDFVEALDNDVSAILTKNDDARVKIGSRNTEKEVEAEAAEHFKEQAENEAQAEKVADEIKRSHKNVFDAVTREGFPAQLKAPAIKAFEVAAELKQEGLADITRPLEGAIAEIAAKADKADTVEKKDTPGAKDAPEKIEDYGMSGALKKAMLDDPAGFEGKVRAFAKKIRETGENNPISTFTEEIGEIKQPPAEGGISPLDNQIGAIDPLVFIETFIKGGKALVDKMFGGGGMSPERRAAFEAMEDREGFRVHERGRKKVEEHFQKTMVDRIEDIETAMLSRNRPLFRKILKEAGVEGWKTIMKMDLSKKASSRTMVEVAELRRDVFEGLNSREKKNLDTLIFEMSMIELGTLKPDVANPEGRLAEDILREHDALRRNPVTRREFKALERRAKKFFKYMERQLKDMLDKGIISRDLFNTLKNRKQYVRREFIDKVDPDNTSGVLRGTPGSVRDPGLRKLEKGGIEALREDAMLQALFYTTVKNNRIARNDALAAVGAHLQANPSSSIGKMHRPGREIPFGMEEFVFLVEGKKRSMVVTKRFAQQLASSDPQMTSTFTKFLSWWSGTPLVRATATAFNPAFALVNFPRDFFWQYFASLEHSPHLPIFFLQMAGDLAATKKFLPSPREFKRDIFKGFARDMIEHGMLPHFLATEGAEEIMQIHPHLEGVVKYAEWFQFNAELWNRLGVAHRAMNNAMEKYKAANGGAEPPRGSEAHDAILQYAAWHGLSVMDFDTGGRYTKAINNFMPYFNPGVVAIRTFLDRIFLKKAPAGSGGSGPGEPKTSNTKIPGSGFSVNDDFLIKAAWTSALGATAWYFANGDEKKREMYEQISDEEKRQYFVIPFPQADYVDENNEVRHAYFRIAKSHEARPFLTIIEAIMDKRAGREIDVGNAVKAAKDAIAFIPEQDAGVPIFHALRALQNFDTWTSKEIWSQLGGPVLPEAEVKYDTNEFLTAAAKTNVGRSLGISPARTQTAVSKLLVPTNPGVMAMGELMSGLAIAGGAEMSQRNIRKDFPSLTRRFPFMERIFRYTQPVKQSDKKNFLEEQQKSNTLNLERNRAIKGHLRREKEGQDERILDDFVDAIEDNEAQKRARKDVSQMRKTMDREKEGFKSGISQLRFLAKPGVSPEAKAGQAYRMWKRKSKKDRDIFEDDLRDHGGIWSKRFKERFFALTDNHNDNNIQK